MSGFLLDTNVLSEFNRRGDPNPLVRQWLEAVDTGSLYASVLTLAEVRFGVELLPPSKRRTQLEEWLNRDLPAWFDGRVLPVDKSIADRWGVLRAQAQMKGRPLSDDRSQSLMACWRRPLYNLDYAHNERPER
jgi:toxin FitB